MIHNDMIGAILKTAQSSISNLLGKEVVVSYRIKEDGIVPFVQAVVCLVFDVDKEQLRTPTSVKRKITDSRYTIYYVLNGFYNLDEASIAKRLSIYWEINIEPQAVNYGIKKISAMMQMKTDPIVEKVNTVLSQIF